MGGGGRKKQNRQNIKICVKKKKSIIDEMEDSKIDSMATSREWMWDVCLDKQQIRVTGKNSVERDS